MEKEYEKWRFSSNISLCLGNDEKYGHSYNGILLGTYSRPTQWWKFEWSWVNLSGSKIFNDKENHAAFLQQLSFLNHNESLHFGLQFLDFLHENYNCLDIIIG